MVECIDNEVRVEQRIDRVLTQYRESPNLLYLMRTYLRQVAEVTNVVCTIPDFFDLDTAVGEQLTLLGQRLGWPRCHCICNSQPVFGFDCNGVPSSYVTGSFCDDGVTWIDCGPTGTTDICITDDDLYRRFLKVRRYQMLSLYDPESLTEAIRIMWGENAWIMDAGVGRVVVAPGRALTDAEMAFFQLYPRVLPVAPGINVKFHLGTEDIIFGFGEGWSGFCEDVYPNGTTIDTEDGDPLVTEDDEEILTGPLTRAGHWMCEIDAHPYDCV